MIAPKVTVTVCVGSSCHLRGSQRVIAALQQALPNHNITDQIELKGDFCLGRCSQGVSVKVNDNIFTGIAAADVENLIREHILPLLKEG